jgi:hypothetical protein
MILSAKTTAFLTKVSTHDAVNNQTGGEVCWRLLLTPDFRITPGFQFIWNPAFHREPILSPRLFPTRRSPKAVED